MLAAVLLCTINAQSVTKGSSIFLQLKRQETSTENDILRHIYLVVIPASFLWIVATDLGLTMFLLLCLGAKPFFGLSLYLRQLLLLYHQLLLWSQLVFHGEYNVSVTKTKHE
jgi:hypothetical protein